MQYKHALASGLLCLALAGFARSQDADQLKKTLKDTEVKDSWIYNDLKAGFAEAQKSGKPLLVVFR